MVYFDQMQPVRKSGKMTPSASWLAEDQRPCDRLPAWSG
jgi:hypothetical protein